MSFLATTAKRSQQIGFVPTVLCAIAWLMCGAIGARVAAGALAQQPMLAQFVVFFIAIMIAAGGLLSFWLIADHVEFWMRGYRVKWVSDNEWLYEERASNSGVRDLKCIRLILGKGYPAPCEVRILSDAAWADMAPLWARGRRAEITQRIASCFGAESGGHVQFADM